MKTIFIILFVITFIVLATVVISRLRAWNSISIGDYLACSDGNGNLSQVKVIKKLDDELYLDITNVPIKRKDFIFCTCNCNIIVFDD
jgi:hypothetical protein